MKQYIPLKQIRHLHHLQQLRTVRTHHDCVYHTIKRLIQSAAQLRVMSETHSFAPEPTTQHSLIQDQDHKDLRCKTTLSSVLMLFF